MTIYTIGHSTRPFPAFVKLLRSHKVEHLVDVRRYPTSVNNPQYNQGALISSLPSEGIDYTFMGDKLGGKRSELLPAERSPNTGLLSEAFRNFADYMLSNVFREAVKELLSLAEGQTVCYMCSEALYSQCHRRLISDHLTVKGHEVRHISTVTKAEPHTLSHDAIAYQGEVIYPKGRSSCSQPITTKPSHQTPPPGSTM